MPSPRKSFPAAFSEQVAIVLDEASVSPKLQRILLAIILTSCLGFRLWTIHIPAIDRTAWKEIDYIAVSENYWRHGFQFFLPEITWPAEPPRSTAMELPAVPFAASLLYPVLGVNPLSVRLVTLLAFLLMSFYVFKLARRELGPMVGLIAALASCIPPLFQTFGSILYSEPLMMASEVMALFHFAEWTDSGRKRDWILSAMAFSLAVALKITPLYLLLPLAWIVFRKHQLKVAPYAKFSLFVLASLVLPVLWYAYAYHLANTSLDVFGVLGGIGPVKGHDKLQTLTMLSDPGWYRTMYDRILWGILGGKIGALLAAAGFLLALTQPRSRLFLAYLAAIGCFFGIVAEGQIDAPYRQLTLVPSLSVLVALGALFPPLIGASLFSLLKSPSRSRSLLATLCLLIACLLVPMAGQEKLRKVLDRDPLEPVHGQKWQFAQAIKSRVGPGAKLVTAGEYSIHKGGNDLSPVLYYFTGLQGWSLQRGDWSREQVESLIQRGATHFAASSMSREPDSKPFLDEMRARYRLLYEGEDELLLELGDP